MEEEQIDAQDQEQDLTWAPPLYTSLDPKAEGRWSVAADGILLWTDDSEGAGITATQNSPLATELVKHFAWSKMAGLPATIAYELALRRAGSEVEYSEEGALSGVIKALDELQQG